MKSIPKRSHSRTRFDYRPNGLSIYYQRSTDDVEEEMMRIRVVTDGKPIDDSLRSSVSSPPESSSWTTLGSTSSVSGTSDKTKKRTKNKHRKRKSKNKNKSSKHQKRMTSRPVILSKKWKTCLRRKKEPEGMDKKSLRILDDLKILNFKIREKISPDSSPSPSDVTRTAVERSHSMSPILTAEAFDYRGRPLKPSLAITPFPGARSVETRKKVREFLLGVGKDKEKKEEKSKKPQFAEFMKPPVPPKEKKKEAPPIKLTRVSSDTRFPGARSPATREKVRLLLKDCVLKKRLKESVNEGPYDNAELTQSLKNIVKERDERKKKEEEEKKKKKKKEEVVKVKKTESTSSSLRTIYSKNAIGCNTCTSCTRCISFCTEQHTRKEKKTTEDSSKSRKAKKDKKKNKKKKKKETISKSSRSYSTSTASESIEISEKSKRKSKKKKSQFF
ncbi:Protein CBG12718 [Caenorhabditis briggsae]|uniref:Protein CBG12718 n=1 Tax=Caenorhabditis briggsae TaxID=6238 RepID=A8XGE8_CAEBR|nr:Protein CBG12718 [Caenorhabditis briggsae]CAP31654.1 Protein CBG12718 [Caenorhabditis briggsae]